MGGAALPRTAQLLDVVLSQYEDQRRAAPFDDCTTAKSYLETSEGPKELLVSKITQRLVFLLWAVKWCRTQKQMDI